MYNYASQIEQQYPQSYQVGIKWRNAVTDFVFGWKAILQKHVTLAEYFKSLSGKCVHAIWSWKDLAPGLIFPILSFYIAKKRR
jgi:predicted ATP-grasp superfamily ATP-dependent carboligase